MGRVAEPLLECGVPGEIRLGEPLVEAAAGNRKARLVLEARPIGLADHPIHVAEHQGMYPFLGRRHSGKVAVPEPRLIVQGGHVQRRDQAFLVLEMMINGPHAHLAFDTDDVDGGRFNALLVEQRQGTSKDVPLGLGTTAWVAAFEEIDRFHFSAQAKRGHGN